jgi:hypothetical protein
MRILFLLAAAGTLLAQTPKLACDGNISTVRVSEIKAGGTMDGFLAAVAAHKAWYRAHGVENEEIFATRVIVRDEATKERRYADNQFMTFHVHASTAPDPKHDESYDAFVKLYRDNSDIKSQYDICLPKPGAR